MLVRRVSVIGVVAVSALTGAGAPRAQTPPATTTRVWTSTWEEHDTWSGRNVVGRSQAQIRATYVEGRDEYGGQRWESRRLVWSVEWEETRSDQLVLATVGGADERGAIQNRYPADIVKRCAGNGTLELGPAPGGTGDDLTPEQKAQLRVPFVTTYHPRDGSAPTPAPADTPPETCNLLQVLGMPSQDELTGCSSEKTWPKGGRPAGSMRISVSAPVTAVIDVDPAGEYGRFVPVPGQALTFVARVPAGTARFRFELHPQNTSHFPGYATNANVDDTFFVKYNLGDLRGRYANDGPDVIFDPAHFGSQEWSRVEPLVVETRTPESSVVVTVTAMDYGAVGELRGFVKSDGCGDWLPIPISIGKETRDAIAIPLDEDHNLMADGLEHYRGRDAGADDDAEPKGNGMAGDGLTAFEEYRGFLVRGVGCGSEATQTIYPEITLTNQSQVAGWSDEHVRTPPGRKNLFVHTPDPEVALVVPAVGEATGLETRVICEAHYGGNDSREVNFTLHKAGMRTFRGQQVAHAEPQHGVYLEPVDRLGLSGLAIPVTEGTIGPPKLTSKVLVLKPRHDTPVAGAIRNRLAFPDLMHAVVHELAHTVGVPHHGDSVENWRSVMGRQNITHELTLQQHAGGPPDFTLPNSLPPQEGSYYALVDGRSYVTSLLVEPGEGCVEGDRRAVYYRNGRFAGCEAYVIARRGEQNSGEFECPMRYVGADYYEAPGSSAEFRWTGLVSKRLPGWSEMHGHLVDAWGGRLLRYQNDKDRHGGAGLCIRITGTGINEARQLDHNGDAGRKKACAEFVVVNDLAARGVR